MGRPQRAPLGTHRVRLPRREARVWVWIDYVGDIRLGRLAAIEDRAHDGFYGADGPGRDRARRGRLETRWLRAVGRYKAADRGRHRLRSGPASRARRERRDRPESAHRGGLVAQAYSCPTLSAIRCAPGHATSAAACIRPHRVLQDSSADYLP